MTKIIMIIVIILTCCDVLAVDNQHKKHKKINPKRKDCPLHKTKPQPRSRVNTTSRLAAIRKIMNGLEALLVTSDDEHQTEMISDSDKRREYISGFSGSHGDAIITMKNAALWTDGRYHIQADEQLDCNWLLMKEEEANVPSKTEWLSVQFPNGGRIGADARLVPAYVWDHLEVELKNFNNNFELVPLRHNLIDNIWIDRPVEIIKEAYTLDHFYTGKTWISKVNSVRRKLKEFGVKAMVVTAVDEVAWLLNIRGWDIPYSGFIKGYVIVTQTQTVLYVNRNKIARNVTKFFENRYPRQLKFRNHGEIWLDLPKYSKKMRILTPSLCAYSGGASKKIYSSVPDEKRLSKTSPIIYLKAKKNPTEISGMQRSHIRDAAALCRFFAHFERRIASGEVWDELQLAKKVDKYRKLQKLYVSQSFPTVAAFGPHGASPHYMPTPTTSIAILNDSTVVIDSGGQYYDGTTDVTRTIHIGTPTKQQRDAYTRVLMGAIQLSSLIFPDNVNTSAVDVMARASLWEIGYDYPHGTGHGIGAFLAVHESPIVLRYNPAAAKPSEPLRPGYFHSIEPGMYLDGKFGIRLENVVKVVRKFRQEKRSGHDYLTFKDITLVPYETKLIDFTLLNVPHRRWLNRYNARIRQLIGPELKRQNAIQAYKWMWKNTKRIPERATYL